jgi:DNA-binding MurR/RpiR family transcriptional regulator
MLPRMIQRLGVLAVVAACSSAAAPPASEPRGAAETIELVDTAARRGAKILAISDSRVSAIAKEATVALQVRDSEVRSFRSLAASMCLAQAVAIGFAFEAERGRGRTRKK